MTRNFGIFGGSFSPPHIGHLLSATYAVAMYNLERLHIVPAYRHPWKTETAPFHDRVQMLLRLLPEADSLVVEDTVESLIDAANPGQPIHTIDVVRRLKKRHPEDRWFLVVGYDEIADLPKWDRYDELMQEVTLAPCPMLTDHHSSRIRKLLRDQAAGRIVLGIDALGLTPPVQEYIEQRDLYQKEET